MSFARCLIIEENLNTSLADANDTVTLVGTLTGIDATELGAFVTGNFQA